jgi:SAM-dependent methyltransferase
MFEFCKSLAVHLLPQSVISRLRVWVRRLRGRYMAVANSDRSAAHVFSEIYERNLWGGESSTFYSGSDISDNPAVSYISLVLSFIEKRKVKSVVDLGCGDFKVGRQIAEACETYIGIDVVPALVKHLRETYSNSHISFACLDASVDELPSGELCLVRQVFQHLSNRQITSILEKLPLFKYVIITEHYPNRQDFRSYNLDKVHGRDTRLDYGSAVYLDRPPFNIKAQTLLLETQPSKKAENIDDVYSSGFLRTYLVEL